MIQQRSNHSFAKHAARTALAPNNNIANIQANTTRALKQQKTNDSYSNVETNEIDKIVESVTNATKRLSQISTNTSSYERKSKSHVGPWRLGRTLGRGSTGRVRLAKHSETGQLAAVKIVPKSKFQKNKGDDDKDSSPYGIEREIIIMKLISHENIMGLYDVWENKGELYLVLEYVEGGELFDYLIKKGKLEEKEALHYFRQIISGVNYCHQFNICHRDLKPENLLLDKNLNIKIADFGMAALEINQKLLETSCGSPHYASPEIVAGKTYHGSPSDVWSCGIILFALLTGHLPFDDENIRKLLMKVQSGRFVTPNFLSMEAKDLIWKMLKVNPNDRIKVYDILNHPLLKKYENSNSSDVKKNDQVKLQKYYHDVDDLKLSRDKIDRDLLTSLSILFHGAKESSLVPKLLAPGSNPEKVFYHLLQQYKQKHQLKESKSKTLKQSTSNGDGLLKKSRSTIHTTIVNKDGSTEVEVTTQKEKPLEAPPQLIPRTPSKKASSKSLYQSQIAASSASRRGVSLNNKQISTSALSISRSSSRAKVELAENSTTNMKKRQSILPPLPDLDSDWLKLDPNSYKTKDFDTDSSEFVALYEAIFTHMEATPKITTGMRNARDQSRAFSSPIEVKKRVDKENEKKEKHSTSKASSSKPEQLLISPQVRSKISSGDFNTGNKRFISEPAAGSQPTIQKSSTLRLSKLMDFKTGTTPAGLTKKSTLDPNYKRRMISNNNADVLNKVGVSLRHSKADSKIFYSKSSTSMNLNTLLKTQTVDKPEVLKEEETKPLHASSKPVSNVPPLPEHRISSSNYPSFEDQESGFNSSNDENSFDFEVPTQTHIAEAIQVSSGNGSDVTVGNNVQAREDSMFQDLDAAAEPLNVFKISNSSKSLIKHHKKSTSSETKILNNPVDIRGSLFNPVDSKDDKTPERINHRNHGYQRPRYQQADEIDEESKNGTLDNSLYADNTDDDNEFVNAKRVTMIFDGYDSNVDDSPVPAFFSSQSPIKPLKSSPLKAIQQSNFKVNPDGTFLKKDDPVTSLDSPKKVYIKSKPIQIIPEVEKAHNSNWFTRFFSSLVSSNNDGKKKTTSKKKPYRVFTPKRSMAETKNLIRNVLEMKRKEGTLNSLKVNVEKIQATIPSTFAFGKPLHFEITYNDENNQITLTKVSGSKKTFKSLINAMEYVIENNSFI